MQKFIRIALPWVCIAVMIWCLFFDGINYLDWTWLVGVAGIGAVCYIGLYVKLHKLQKQLQKTERGASLSVEETGRRGRRGCCARIGEGKGQLVEKGDDKAQIGKRIY